MIKTGCAEGILHIYPKEGKVSDANNNPEVEAAETINNDNGWQV